MEALVIARFKDRDGKIREPGETVERTAARMERLVAKKCVRPLPASGPPVVESAKVDDTPEPKHVGGGWYQLPDGTKVRGIEEAREAMG